MTRPTNPDPENDGVDRRGFLKCMAWAGTGALWAVDAGVPTSKTFGQAVDRAKGSFSFAQISDSHIGFGKEPYGKTVKATLEEAVARINALPQAPGFLVHTGDLTHLSTARESDAVSEILKGAKVGKVFYVPGEHDVVGSDAEYLKRLGILGVDQFDWLKADLAGFADSTPIVVFAHVPLWSIYPSWGWGTEDGLQALGHLKRFGSVTVLNGHVHQALQKVEGNIAFHTARSTGFPQPAPGAASAPGPLKDVEAGRLRSLLGLTGVAYCEGRGPRAVTDLTLDY